MYNIHHENNISILYRIRKSDGKKSEVCRVIDTGIDKLLMIDKSKRESYIVKSDDEPATLELVGNTYIGSFASKVNIYIKPHHTALHFERMRANTARYSLATSKIFTPEQRDNLILDEDTILSNMLECIASI